MKKFRKFLSSPKATAAIFGAAVVLLLFSSIGGARAALEIQSQTHQTKIETEHIAVQLLEGDKGVAIGEETKKGTLSFDVLKDENGKLKMTAGKSYPEVLSVKNTGDIDQYTRVTIYKYWVKSVDEKGNVIKATDLWPGYIELTLADGWVVDTKASTPERTVIYYKNILKADENKRGDGEEKDFVTSMRIDPEVIKIVNDDGREYQNHSIKVEVEVDAVQTHQAADAILSTWGCRVDNSAADPDNGVLKELIFNW